MPSFQTSITPTRRTAARFISRVRRALQQAYVDEHRKRGITQSDIARELGIHRSVINRELRGERDLTLGRIAELAHVLGKKPIFELVERVQRPGSNSPTSSTSAHATGFVIFGNNAPDSKTGASASAFAISSKKLELA